MDSNTSDIYIASIEHSSEELEKVKQLESEEKIRRMGDAVGEEHRRAIANQVSEIFSEGTRINWFQKGYSYVFQILKLVRLAGDDMLRASQVRAMRLTSSASSLAGQKGAEVSQKMKHTINLAAEKGKATTEDVRQKVAVASEKIGQKGSEASQGVKSKFDDAAAKAQALAYQGSTKAQELAHQGSARAQEFAHQGFEKIQEVAIKLKDASLKLVGKAKSIQEDISQNINVAFAVLEEENEREYRLASEFETYAILNAINVSSLIKGLGYEFYRPASEPSGTYLFKLMENYESRRRQVHDQTDHTSVHNARLLSTMIEEKFRAKAAPAIIPAKEAYVEPAKVHAPMGATM